MQNKDPSIIIPIYNTPQQLLVNCLSSIQENIDVMDGVEVLMINDGSTDVVIESILKEKAKENASFHYIFKTNSGVSNTRNMGIELAQGKYIMFMDADDYLESNVLRYLLNTAEKVGLDMTMFGYCIDGDGTPKVEYKQVVQVDDEALGTLVSNDLVRWFKINTNLASVWAKIYWREALIKNKISFQQDIAPHEDGYFTLCLLSKISSFYIDNVLVYHYVIFDGSAIHSFSACDIRVSKIILPKLEVFVNHYASNKNDFISAITTRTFSYIRHAKTYYFTHPKNTKSFWELKDFLATPIIHKYIQMLHFSDAKNSLELKNIILLKLHLYWIFLLTERRKCKSVN